MGNDVWFTDLILMFQKEVADRIIARNNTSNYGRISIISNWKMDIKKILDVSPNCFFPRPKVDSTVLHFTLKDKFYSFKKSKNLEKISRIFFNQRRKMIKNPMRQLFTNYKEIAESLKLDLNLRPQNLELDTYYKLTKEYEKLRS